MRLDLGYDGTAFSGWAAQPGLRTVEGELTAGLGRVLRAAPPPRVTVAGRTDAGVHARGQVVHADVVATTWATLPGRGQHSPGQALVRRLAGVLAPDVVVRSAEPAAAGFDARFSATSRRYCYRVADSEALRDPLRRREVLWHRRPLDVAAMDTAVGPLLGEHDWLPYCRPREGATTVRRLLDVGWRRDDDGLAVLHIEADAFCHHMVRSIVGASLAVGEGRRPVGWPAAVLQAGVRDSAVAVAPAHGLVLEAVTYPPDERLAERAALARRRRDRGPVA